MAAERLATVGIAVTVYEQMPSVGRKLLLAGRGGLNLTHSEPTDRLLSRYREAQEWLEPSVRSFDADALRAWCASLGQPTFVGSSGRVFPESFRATELLRAWLARLDELDVEIRVRHRWLGWITPGGTDTGVRIGADDGTDSGAEFDVRPDIVVFALGGASWPKVGSDAAWVDPFVADDIVVSALRASNCGFEVEWSDVFRQRFAGKPIKNACWSVDVDVDDGEAPESSRAECVVTETGLEGGAIYALSASVRDALELSPPAVRLVVDLQPDLTHDHVVSRLERRRPKESWSSVLKRDVGLSAVAIGLMREATANQLPDDVNALARLIKSTKLEVGGIESVERSISTAGGVTRESLDDSFMLTSRPGTFVVGEMLDWEAPTGGYLLQATFSTAVAAAEAATRWIDRDR